MIELENVSLSYGDRPVLRSLNLRLQEGERIALLGPSGTGKTTLLHLLAGLLKPDGGSVQGLPADGSSVVFQENRLLPWLSVLDNLLLVSPGQSRQRLAALLEELGLGEELDSAPGALSGGMARRVAIARAVAFDRSLFLLDEPFKGLDEQTLKSTMEFVNRHTVGKTLVLITHSPQEALALNARQVHLGELQLRVGERHEMSIEQDCDNVNCREKK